MKKTLIIQNARERVIIPLPIIAFLILIAVATPVVARLGETLDECKQRYGKVLRLERSREDFPQYCFRKGDIKIRVRLLNGRSGQEVFSGAGGGRMSQDQINEILIANSDGFDWRPGPPTREPEQKETYSASWELIRSDGAAHADYFAMAHIASDGLIVETFEFKKAFEAPGAGF